MQPKEKGRTRAAGIVFKDDVLLVMFRRKNGREYYTFPGGGVEERESPEDAVVREIYEEATVVVDTPALVYELHRGSGNARDALPSREFFYRCVYQSGVPALGSDSIECAIFDKEKNYFEPKWVKSSDLADMLLLPPEVAMQLLHDMAHGFGDAPTILNGSPLQNENA
jgi:8-oxo-dGTP pyrophosphatase MutT (NUDIX family)